MASVGDAFEPEALQVIDALGDRLLVVELDLDAFELRTPIDVASQDLATPHFSYTNVAMLSRMRSAAHGIFGSIARSHSKARI